MKSEFKTGFHFRLQLGKLCLLCFASRIKYNKIKIKKRYIPSDDPHPI